MKRSPWAEGWDEVRLILANHVLLLACRLAPKRNPDGRRLVAAVVLYLETSIEVRKASCPASLLTPPHAHPVQPEA